MKASENRKFLGTICTSKVHSTPMLPCVCFHKFVWLEITLGLNLDILPQKSVFEDIKLTLCFCYKLPFVEFMCLHKQTQDGKKERERKQILQTWTSRGKRRLLEEKQKCLRTFLCDYTVLDKSRHSCSHFVFWAFRSVNRSAFICPCLYVLRHFSAIWLDSWKLRAVEGKENCQFVLIMLV